MNATKFTFDTEFRGEHDLTSNASRVRQRKSYTHEEIDAMCARARAEGMKAGQVRAAEAAAAGARDAAAALSDLLARTHEEVERVRGEFAELAIAAARKLARTAIAALPQQEVEAALRSAMHQAIGEPRIVLRAGPEVAQALQDRVPGIAHEEGFDGRVQISADPGFKGSDCRIDWRGGGIERVEDALEATLSELVSRMFRDTVPETQE